MKFRGSRGCFVFFLHPRACCQRARGKGVNPEQRITRLRAWLLSERESRCAPLASLSASAPPSPPTGCQATPQSTCVSRERSPLQRSQPAPAPRSHAPAWTSPGTLGPFLRGLMCETMKIGPRYGRTCMLQRGMKNAQRCPIQERSKRRKREMERDARASQGGCLEAALGVSFGHQRAAATEAAPRSTPPCHFSSPTPGREALAGWRQQFRSAWMRAPIGQSALGRTQFSEPAEASLNHDLHTAPHPIPSAATGTAPVPSRLTPIQPTHHAHTLPLWLALFGTRQQHTTRLTRSPALPARPLHQTQAKPDLHHAAIFHQPPSLSSKSLASP